MRSDPTFSGESGAREFLRNLLSDIENTLSSSKAILTDDDRLRLLGSKVQMPMAFAELEKLLEAIRNNSPSAFRNAYICLHQLMLGAFNAGAVCAVSDSARDFLRKPIVDGARSGGERRGAQKKKEAARRWRNDAQSIYAANRSKLSQGKLADLIADKIESAPGREQIILYIRELDRLGKSLKLAR